MATDSTRSGHDVAVAALGHILSRSEAARGALESTLREGGTAVGSIARVGAEVIGGEGERSGLAGYDDEGAVRVLISAMFWTGLTRNQPNGYFRWLPLDRPAAVLFVAPAARLASLWPELCRRADEQFTIIGATTPGDLRAATVSGGERRVDVDQLGCVAGLDGEGGRWGRRWGCGDRHSPAARHDRPDGRGRLTALTVKRCRMKQWVRCPQHTRGH